jgi:hypothetical protein
MSSLLFSGIPGQPSVGNEEHLVSGRHVAHHDRHDHGGEPGVDVMITIFCDFSQFSAKKLAFFLNINAMSKLFQKLALF